MDFLETVTCVYAVPRGLDGLRPLSVKHHEDELQTVDAQVQQCPASHFPLRQASDVGEWSSQIGPHQPDITNFTPTQQPPHFEWCRKEARPNCLKVNAEWSE